MIPEDYIPILTESDILTARQEGREIARNIGFSSSELAIIAAAISELARNIIIYAKQGQIVIKEIKQNGKLGISITAEDKGPGIKDVSLALQEGYSTSDSLGLGLPGVKRLMDHFEIHSKPGIGTIIVIIKWLTAL